MSLYQTRNIRSVSDSITYEEIPLSDSDSSTDLMEQGLLSKEYIQKEIKKNNCGNYCRDYCRDYCNSTIIGISLIILLCLIFFILITVELLM